MYESINGEKCSQTCNSSSILYARKLQGAQSLADIYINCLIIITINSKFKKVFNAYRLRRTDYCRTKNVLSLLSYGLISLTSYVNQTTSSATQKVLPNCAIHALRTYLSHTVFSIFLSPVLPVFYVYLYFIVLIFHFLLCSYSRL